MDDKNEKGVSAVLSAKQQAPVGSNLPHHQDTIASLLSERAFTFIACKGIILRLGFEFDEKVNKTNIKPLLLPAGVVVYRAVGLTGRREFMVDVPVIQTGRVDDSQIIEVAFNDIDLKNSD